MSAAHIPVLAAEMLETLAPQAGNVYLDGTFGRGGYTRAILNAADCTVCALDCDPDAIAQGRETVAEFAGRLELKSAPG